MRKALRLLSVVLFLIATFAFASTSANGKAVLASDGSGPIPLCYPYPCGPDGGGN